MAVNYCSELTFLLHMEYATFWVAILAPDTFEKEASAYVELD